MRRARSAAIGSEAADDRPYDAAQFGAHAWIERDGQALLWSGGSEFERLVEL